MQARPRPARATGTKRVNLPHEPGPFPLHPVHWTVTRRGAWMFQPVSATFLMQTHCSAPRSGRVDAICRRAAARPAPVFIISAEKDMEMNAGYAFGPDLPAQLQNYLTGCLATRRAVRGRMRQRGNQYWAHLENAHPTCWISHLKPSCPGRICRVRSTTPGWSASCRRKAPRPTRQTALRDRGSARRPRSGYRWLQARQRNGRSEEGRTSLLFAGFLPDRRGRQSRT